MDGREFKEFGAAMMDFITNYQENIRERAVKSSVEPGYLQKLLPTEAPQEGEDWKTIMGDIEKVIMPGLTHWQSPNFHAYFPSATSYPSIVADMLSGALGSLGFTWMATPAYTELEVVMMDWLGQIIDLPQKFLSARSERKGGGVIMGSASESTFVTLLSAKDRIIKKYKSKPDFDETTFAGKLVAYTSDQTHCSVEKSALLAGVKMTLVKTDDELAMRGEALRLAIEEDKKKGLFPFFVTATLGTTNSCAFDNLDEVGDVCKTEDIWLHVDAAYAGAAFVCEEYRYLMKGIEKVDSFNFNPHKWLLVNFDCAALWVANAKDLEDALYVDASTFVRPTTPGQMPDFRHWQVPLGRRFRSLKLWFVMRIYGVNKLKEHIRTQIGLAHYFANLLKDDTRFELVIPVVMALACFRLKGETNERNEQLLKKINERGKIHMVPAVIHGQYVIRFAIGSAATNENDVAFAWKEILNVTEQFLS